MSTVVKLVLVVIVSFFVSLLFGMMGFAVFGTLLFWVILIGGVIAVLRGRTATAPVPNELAGYPYTHAHAGTAIGVAPERRTLILKMNKKVRTYSFDQVRDWEKKWASGGHLINTSGSFTQGLATVGANSRISRQNKQDSGLFVSVKDIDEPVWRIAFHNTKDLNRWYEIMQQTINES